MDLRRRLLEQYGGYTVEGPYFKLRKLRRGELPEGRKQRVGGQLRLARSFPMSPSAKYAVITGLAKRCEPGNAERVFRYINASARPQPPYLPR